MIGRIRWDLSAGAVLLFALLYFFDPGGYVSALVPAVLVHELGHAAALRCGRARLRRVSVGVFGIEMDYAGMLSGAQTLFALAAGPGAGVLYALAACSMSAAFWRLSGALSFCLSVFNLLPVLPLDGGRIVVELTGERFARRLSRLCAAVLLLSGAALFGVYRFPALMAAGLWLCGYNFNAKTT